MPHRTWLVEQVQVTGGVWGKPDERALIERLTVLHDQGWTILSVAAGCGHTSVRLVTAWKEEEE